MNDGNYGLIHDLLQSLMSSVQWTPCFINGATSSCERSRWLKRVIIQISVYPQEGGGTRAKRGEVERRAKPPRSSQAAAKQTENSFKRDGWSQERSSTHDEALCVQLLMCLWTIHSEKLQKKWHKQLKKKEITWAFAAATTNGIALLFLCHRWFLCSWQLRVNGHVCRLASAKVLIALLYLPRFPQRPDTARAFVSRVIPSR